MTAEVFSSFEADRILLELRRRRPLVHCLTNDVVQEMTANVLLAAGASPAMTVAPEETLGFAKITDALLVNLGTPTRDRIEAMQAAVAGAAEGNTPWVLDPVAAGVIPWRDGVIREFLRRKPVIVRGNASEILALAGAGTGGQGVDSTDASSAALEPARRLALQTGVAVCVTGEVDYATDGRRTLAVPGGSAMATLVVGTGCSLSALVAAFAAVHPDPVEAAAAACTLAKRAAEYAARQAQAPGRFHSAYIDGLYLAPTFE